MKISSLLAVFLLTTTVAIGQHKEKIKGSKIVVEKPKEIEEFTALEVEDNLTVYLTKGPINLVKIEADDNLLDNISFDVKEKTLRVYTPKEAVKFKKLIVRITYTSDLKSVVAKNVSIINAIEAIQLEDITFSALDYAKLYLNVNSTNFKLIGDDKTKTELNLKSEKATIKLSKNTQIKALIATKDLAFDMYQKSEAVIEGDSKNAIIRLDNNSIFTGNKFTAKNAEVTTERDAVCTLITDKTLIIDATDSSKINILGTPQIEIRKFLGKAELIKKPK